MVLRILIILVIIVFADDFYDYDFVREARRKRLMRSQRKKFGILRMRPSGSRRSLDGPVMSMRG